tara:strand:- start:12794 stop:13015 length:222 start_codon:yes stop_codon:yes gene_type:complete
MLQVNLIIEIEEEFMNMGYKFGLVDRIAGWVHETEPFVRIRDQGHHLKDMGKLNSWKRDKYDNWKEVKNRVKQ